MTALIALLARLGLPEGLRRGAARALLAATALTALALLKGCYDRSVVARHQARIEARASSARERAATERAADLARDKAKERTLHDAIRTAPGGALSPAAHALACERLRQVGRIPPACRPAGPDRGQAGPD